MLSRSGVDRLPSTLRLTAASMSSAGNGSTRLTVATSRSRPAHRQGSTARPAAARCQVVVQEVPLDARFSPWSARERLLLDSVPASTTSAASLVHPITRSRSGCAVLSPCRSRARERATATHPPSILLAINGSCRSVDAGGRCRRIPKQTGGRFDAGSWHRAVRGSRSGAAP